MRNAIIAIVSVLLFSNCDSILEKGDLNARSRIVGEYVLDEYSETYNADFSYEIEILSALDSDNEVRILNFYDSDVSVTAVVDGDKIFIPFQEKGNLEIEGVGTVYGNVINMNYSVFDKGQNDSFPDYCSTTATRIK